MLTIRIVAIATLSIVAFGGRPQESPTRCSDLGIYSAVLEKTIRPLVARRRSEAGGFVVIFSMKIKRRG